MSERALVLIDGEHYAPVVRDALAALPYDVVGALLVGGTEKLRGDDDYGVPLVEALDAVEADLVVDLSDEPVLGPRERMLWASRALALGLPYVGADFRFDPPPFDPVEAPSLAVIGLGKRIGKTAVAGHVARVLAARPPRRRRGDGPRRAGGAGAGRDAADARRPARALPLRQARRVRPSRGGRARRRPGDRLPARGGRARGRAVRCRTSSRARGSPRSSIPSCSSSTAAAPRCRRSTADARILVANGGHDARAGLNAYRVLVSDLVVDTGGADREAIRSISDVPVVAAELRLRPAEPLHGRRTAVFTTGAAPTEELDAEIVHVSRNLARRDALREELERVDAEVYLVELKAAAIDVVAEAALARGAEVVLAANDVVSDELDERVLALVAAGGARMSEPRRIMPLPLGGDELGLPYSRGLMARSLMAAGVAGHRAYALASRVDDELARARRGPDRARAARGARGRGARRGGGTRVDPAPAPLPGAPRARPADHGLHRRRDRHRQVDGRDRARVPLRHHARHVDRLRAADDARVLLARRSCPRSTSRASRRATSYPGRRRPARVRLPAAGAERPRRRRAPRPSARSRRAGRSCSRASTSCRGWSSCRGRSSPSRSSSCSRSRTRRSTCAISATATRTRSSGPSRATSSASTTSAGCRSSSSARAQRAGVPVIENEDADRAARTVADLVLDAAEQSRTVTR